MFRVMKQVGQAIDDTLQIASFAPGEVDLVVRTGGSSLIPVVGDELKDRFPGRVVEFDAFQSIAAGLAMANYQNLQFQEN
jgi:hypothetical chaperone protein